MVETKKKKKNEKEKKKAQKIIRAEAKNVT